MPSLGLVTSFTFDEGTARRARAVRAALARCDVERYVPTASTQLA